MMLRLLSFFLSFHPTNKTTPPQNYFYVQQCSNAIATHKSKNPTKRDLLFFPTTSLPQTVASPQNKTSLEIKKITTRQTVLDR